MKQNIVLSLVLFIWLIPETYSVTYVHDPSSLALSCNPYGRDIKLKCAIQEPTTLKSPLSFLILWYWSGRDTSTDVTYNGCQLYPSYQCSHYIGHSKYMFEFKRYKENDPREGFSDSLLYRKLELTVRNISTSDIGCYYCRPWIDLVPLNETSGAFCIEPQYNYEGLPSCTNNDSNIMMNPSSVVSNNINDPISSSMMLNFPSTTYAIPDMSSFVPQPSNRPQPPISMNIPLQRSTNKHSLGVWLYVCITLCLVLSSTTLVLIIVMVLLIKKRKRRNKHTTTGHHSALQQDNTGYENRIITPSTIIHQPGFIGTYSYVQTTPKTPSPPDTLQFHMPITNPLGRYRLPGSQIYKTLDKHIKELECYSKPPQESLFDDPNYSPVCTSHVPSLIILAEEGISTYDKLASKPTSNGDYAYSYVRINNRQRQGQPIITVGSDTITPQVIESHSNDELLRIAALGTYEMDPELISTLKRNPSDERIQENSSCYQSLDQKTLSPHNSYTTINRIN